MKTYKELARIAESLDYARDSLVRLCHTTSDDSLDSLDNFKFDEMIVNWDQDVTNILLHVAHLRKTGNY